MDPKLLELIACPVSKAPLKWDKKNNELISVGMGLAYPINNGIPILIEEQARQMSAEEQEQWR